MRSEVEKTIFFVVKNSPKKNYLPELSRESAPSLDSFVHLFQNLRRSANESLSTDDPRDDASTFFPLKNIASLFVMNPVQAFIVRVCSLCTQQMPKPATPVAERMS